MADLTTRPNIRVEIRNNLVEPMEIDDSDRTTTGEFEEGEINEPNEAVSTNTNSQSAPTPSIFDKEKLLERAKRFDLKPDEVVIFTEQELHKLYKSLGVTDANTKEIRFDTIHMRGTQEMSTEDVLNYFYKFAPNSIEWIDDESCNIVWSENESAARALYFTSKPIAGVPVRGPCDPFIKELYSDTDDTPKGTSILLKNKNREVHLKDEDSSEDAVEKDPNAVDLSEITCPIPPGYWRSGAHHPKAQHILLRYAFRTDKKPFKAERFSEYYRKHGNPNYGNLKGIISDTHKKKLKGIFDRNHDISKDTGKNPWGSLAENWDEDVQFREPEFTLPILQNKENKGIMNRLGFKRGLDENTGEDVKKSRTKVPRMRMYADEEEAKMKKKKQMVMVKQEGDLNPTDLRNILGKNTKPVIKVEEPEEKVVDLGTRLKNRHKQTTQKEYFVDFIKSDRDEVHSHKTTERRHKESSNRRHKEYYENRYEDEELEYDNRTRSKVTVVVKRQRQPLVASAILPRQKVTERTRPHRRQSSESSDESSSSSSSSSTTTSTNSESSSDEESDLPKRPSKTLQRPGFKNDLKLLSDEMGNHKSPLRIEISNDLFKKK